MTVRQYLTAEEMRGKLLSLPNKQYSDTVLDDMIQVATSEVEKYTERVFSQDTYTEKWRGDGSTTFLVYQYPIISITSMYQDTVANPSITTQYDTTNRLIRTSVNIDNGRIELDGLDLITSFSPLSIYRLIYDGGYATVPADIKHATALWCAELLRQNYGLGGGGANTDIVTMSAEQIAEILNPIRRRRI